MSRFDLFRKGYEILDSRERKSAVLVLVVVVISALSSAIMVGSIMPFLTVLSDTTQIHDVFALKWAYEIGGFNNEYNFLIALGVGALVVIFASNLIQIGRIYAETRFSTMRMHSISCRLLSGYLRQPYEFFLNRNTAELGTKILSESQQVVAQFFRPLINAVAAGLTIAAIVGLVLWVNALIAILAFIIIGGIYGATFALSRAHIGRLGHVRLSANQQRYQLANEALAGIKDIKLIGRERTYVDAYSRPSYRMTKTQVSTSIIGQMPQYLMQAIAFGGMILLCLLLLDPKSVGSGRALGGIIPTLGVFAFAGQRLIPELQRLYQSLTQLNYGKAAVDSVYTDLIQNCRNGNGRSNVVLPHFPPKPLGLKEGLRLEDVSYRYPNADQPAIQNVKLSIDVGERIGVVGPSGAGKTSFADIVLGLLPPTEGAIRVDGQVIDEFNLREWQQTVGYVPQHIFLTDSSVAENIALGVPTSSIDWPQVYEAARIARIQAFVEEELPAGYETLIGERGVRLSGGQRQRIGIARALYHDADFIVFDEATSALDSLTEKEVMDAIDALPQDKTVIVIAHRLSTVRRCDRIVVLEGGQVKGCDEWDNLMQENCAFRRLVTADQKSEVI